MFPGSHVTQSIGHTHSISRVYLNSMLFYLALALYAIMKIKYNIQNVNIHKASGCCGILTSTIYIFLNQPRLKIGSAIILKAISFTWTIAKKITDHVSQIFKDGCKFCAILIFFCTITHTCGKHYTRGVIYQYTYLKFLKITKFTIKLFVKSCLRIYITLFSYTTNPMYFWNKMEP